MPHDHDCHPVQFSLEKLNVAEKNARGNEPLLYAVEKSGTSPRILRAWVVCHPFVRVVCPCEFTACDFALVTCLSLCTARDYVTHTYFLPLLHAPVHCVQQASFTSLHVTAKLPCNMADCVLRLELLLCHGRNYVFIFYSFELKLCRMVELCIPKHPMFFVLDFNGFWRENDVKRLTAKFKFRVMAKQRNDFGRAWRDKNKSEKSSGHVLLTKRTCKNIQEPTVCRIVLGRLNLKLCPETKKKKNTRILFVKKPANHGHKLMNKPWFGAQKDFCTEVLCLPITVDVAILIRQRPVNLWKIARTKLTGFLFVLINFSEQVS